MKIITWLLFTFICLLPAGSMAQNKVTLSGKSPTNTEHRLPKPPLLWKTPPPAPIRTTRGNIHCKSLRANIPSLSPFWATKP